MTPQPRPDLVHDPLLEALDVLSDGVAVFDVDRRLVATNAEYRDMLSPIIDYLTPGTRWEDILAASIKHDVYQDSKKANEEWATNLSGGQSPALELTQWDGRIVWIRHEPTPSGGFVAIRTDVTEMRAAEAAKRERDELISHILDFSPVGVTLTRLDTSEILFRSKADVERYGENTFARSHYADPKVRDRYAETLKRDGKIDGFRATLVTPEGEERPVSISGRLTEFQGVECAVSAATDLTPYLEQAAKVRRVLEAFPAPVLMTEARSGSILFKSPEIDALYGPLENTRSYWVSPADRKVFLTELRAKGQLTDRRCHLLNAQGEPFWAAVSARLIEFDRQEVIVSYSRDLTEEIDTQAELARQREQIFQTEKMTALGGLLAGVAHELNNPLSVVVGHALMLRDASDDPEIARQTGKISDAAERCARIVKTFLAMARQKPVQRSKTDLNAVVSTALDVARFADGAGHGFVTLETELDPGLPQISVDADQMTQVLINLVLNAETAIVGAGKGGAVRVRTGCDTRGLVITVEDTGPGVPADIAKRIFEPFFTTREVGEGTGIGLSFCHRVVEAHGGDIRLDTTYAPGARFVITLPLEAQGEPAPVDIPTPAPKGQARILVIDDEADVADLNAEMLRRAGYDVAVAYEGAAGVAMLEGGGFDAVVSDLNMPGLDGRGVYEEVGRVSPALAARTGFITGDTMGRTSQSFLKEARRPYLEKPVSPRELREFVAELLNEETTR